MFFFRSDKDKWPITSVKCHSSASNLNSESILFDRVHTTKTFPDLNMTLRVNWPKLAVGHRLQCLWAVALHSLSGISTNTSNNCCLAMLVPDWEEMTHDQHKAGVFAVLLRWNILLNVYQVLGHESYANKALWLNLNTKHYGTKNKTHTKLWSSVFIL